VITSIEGNELCLERAKRKIKNKKEEGREAK